MKHDATKVLLEAHAGSTWRAWLRHWSTCGQCNKQSTVTPIEAGMCLEGAADFDEFRIANNRLVDHYRGVRSE